MVDIICGGISFKSYLLHDLRKNLGKNNILIKFLVKKQNFRINIFNKYYFNIVNVNIFFLDFLLLEQVLLDTNFYVVCVREKYNLYPISFFKKSLFGYKIYYISIVLQIFIYFLISILYSLKIVLVLPKHIIWKARGV